MEYEESGWFCKQKTDDIEHNFYQRFKPPVSSSVGPLGNGRGQAEEPSPSTFRRAACMQNQPYSIGALRLGLVESY
jgi:hypothetical protein